MSWARSRRRFGPEISLLVPWGGGDRPRVRALAWLRRYWRHELSEAEFIIGRDWGRPFSKTAAFNDAAHRARGLVFVLLDADALLRGSTLREASRRIIEDLEDDDPLGLWFVPYRRLYRLSEETTDRLLRTPPSHPWRPPDPCPAALLEGPDQANYGRRYGAMAMVIPAAAWLSIGGGDERFRGWGGEDVSTLRALDTLWGKHKSIDGAVFHLWHPRVGRAYGDRRWRGQHGDNVNGSLASRYSRASRDPVRMREVIEHEEQEVLELWVRIIRWLRRLLDR